LNRNKLPPKPRSCQKLEKSIFKYSFIEFWLEKSCHQNQDRAKSWKNQFLNTFFVVPPFHILRCLCHLFSRHGNKSRRNQVWILFTSMLNRKKLPPEPRSFQKVRKSIFEYFSNWIYIYTFFLLIWSVQQKDQERCLCHLFCEKRVWNFTFWDVCAIYLVVMGTKAGENNFEYFFN